MPVYHYHKTSQILPDFIEREVSLSSRNRSCRTLNALDDEVIAANIHDDTDVVVQVDVLVPGVLLQMGSVHVYVCM